MGKRHGKDGVVNVGSNVMKTTKWTLEETVPTSDDTDMGDAATTHLTGIPSWTASIDAWLNKAETTGQGALTIGAEVTLKLYDDGTGSGATYHSGTGTVTRIGRTVDKDNTISVSFNVQGNGALTHPTVTP